mgnify:CR=1 FL=1
MMMNDNAEAQKPTTRVDPVDEVQRILRVYSGPARSTFRMHLERLLVNPEYFPKGGAGSVENRIRRLHHMLKGHPELEEKRAAIYQLLGLSPPQPRSQTST